MNVINSSKNGSLKDCNDYTVLLIIRSNFYLEAFTHKNIYLYFFNIDFNIYCINAIYRYNIWGVWEPVMPHSILKHLQYTESFLVTYNNRLFHNNMAKFCKIDSSIQRHQNHSNPVFILENTITAYFITCITATFIYYFYKLDILCSILTQTKKYITHPSTVYMVTYIT